MKRFLLVFLALFFLTSLLNACKDKPREESASGDPDTLYLIRDGQCPFAVVRPKTAKKAVIKTAAALRKALDERAENAVIIREDAEKITEADRTYEILVGETNRPESAELFASLDYGWAVKRIGAKIVIVGSTPDFLSEAADAFLSCLTNAPQKDCVIEENLFLEQSYPFPGTAAAFLDAGRDFDLKADLKMTCPGYGEYTVAQGAASDDQYVYFLLRTRKDGYGIVCKYDWHTGSLVKRSEPLWVYHGNDMTFDPVKNLLFIAHGSAEGKRLTPVDPETLLPAGEDIELPVGAGAVAYSKKTGGYAVSQGGKTLIFLDEYFKNVVAYSRSVPSGYTPQGMGSDGEFFYFPLSGEKDNLISVYNADGELIKNLHLPLALESESLFEKDGILYVSFYHHGGAKLYRLTPVAK